MGGAGAALNIDPVTGLPAHVSPGREAALLSWIQQFAPYGVVTLDETFKVQTWNHWMELHSGKRLADLAGKSLFELFPDLRERKMTGHFERALKGESCVLSTALHRYLLRLPSPYREPGITEMLQTARIAPLFSNDRICGVVLVIEDVTQRESQAAALGRQHRRDELLSWALAHLLRTEQPRKAIRQLFFKIAEHMDFDTFFIYVRNLETGQLNLEAVGGLPKEADKEFAECPFQAFLAEGSPELLVLNRARMQQSSKYAPLINSGISAAVVIPLLLKDRNLGLLCFATCVRDSITSEETDLLSMIGQYFATALDRENTNSQLHKAKEQLSEHAQLLERNVQERTARLQETISELETFSYTIAHDLRAPARSMTGYCDVMLEDFADGVSAEARMVIEKIARASRRMEALTHDLLEFSKVSRQEVALVPLQIEPIIEDLSALRLPAVRQAITIRSPLHRVLGNPGLLQHVFSNLIDNAIKFVQPDTLPKITIWTQTVSSASPNTRSRPLIFSSTETPSAAGDMRPAEQRPQQIRIFVSDEGIGIHRQAHQKIFGIFERGLSSDRYEGTGIGLAIVARAMQRMGGTCGVESEPGKGSLFWLELPAV